MKRRHLVKTLAFLSFFSMGLYGCAPEASSTTPGTSDTANNTTPTAKPSVPSQIILKLTAPADSLKVGETLQLEATIQNAKDPSLSWKSDNEEIATVDDKGLVTGVAPGEVMISVSSVEDPSKAQAVYLTVKDINAFTITQNTDDTDTYKVEAEDLDMTDATVRQDFIDAGRNQFENCENASNGQSICGLIPPTVLSIQFKTEAACTVDIQARLAAGTPEVDVNLDGVLSFGVDDKTIEKTGIVLPKGSQGSDLEKFFNWNYHSVGKFDLEAGVHTFTISVIGQFPNADCFSFLVSNYGA